MPATLTDRLRALDRERAAFLAALAALSQEARTAHPAPDAWSAVQIAEHTFRSEAAVLRGIERQLAAGDDRKDVGRHSRGAVVLLLAAMRAPKKIAMPEGARGIAPEGMAYEAVRDDWAALEARWHAAAAACPPALEKTPLVRHPIAGALTFDDALRFLTAHASRHRRQLARAAQP